LYIRLCVYLQRFILYTRLYVYLHIFILFIMRYVYLQRFTSYIDVLDLMFIYNVSFRIYMFYVLQR